MKDWLTLDNLMGMFKAKTTYASPITPPVQPKPTVVGGVDWEGYATNPNDAKDINAIYKSLPTLGSAKDVTGYIQSKFPKSQIKGEMIWDAALEQGIDPGIIMARLQQESQFGTVGLGAKTNNPGNYGNTGTSSMNFKSMEEGIKPVIKWAAKHKM